ncbi:MAG TPA: Clp protease N-terminal domain-containing protein [Actinomycetes bacterium]|jgi:ATP-dependent Clp protease ATP-binding subunit ClpC|nr:Clp protease N-terminal domain-containing protein [Actinomycetes bacterium]
MFERFTDEARRAVDLAREEAQLRRRRSIDAVDLLLGVLREGGGVGAKVLTSIGITLEAARRESRGSADAGGRTTQIGDASFSGRARRVLEASIDEAEDLGYTIVGTGHLVLGLLREGDLARDPVLERLGAPHDHVRAQVTRLLSALSGPPI